MAVNNAIRRAASRVVPLAVWASPGSQRYLHHLQRGALPAAVNQPSRNFFSRSTITEPKSDQKVLRAIDAEIKSVLAVKEVKVPKGFPFEIEYLVLDHKLTLTREYNGETITVEARQPREVYSDEDDDDDDNDDDDDDNDEEEEQEIQLCIPMVVTVSKSNGARLEFELIVFADKIDIEFLRIKRVEGPESYEGVDENFNPDFWALDKNLRKSFCDYLEIRGITPSFMFFLPKYILNREELFYNKDYLPWLESLQKSFRRHKIQRFEKYGLNFLMNLLIACIIY